MRRIPYSLATSVVAYSILLGLSLHIGGFVAPPPPSEETMVRVTSAVDNPTVTRNVAATVRKNGNSRNSQHASFLYPEFPLGCSQSNKMLGSFLAEDYKQPADGQAKHNIESHLLTKLALEESNIPVGTTKCDLLIPVSYAQQALRNKISFHDKLGMALSRFLPEDVVEVSNEYNGSGNSEDLLLQLIAASLARSIPIVSDQTLADLAVGLGMAFYYAERGENQVYLCGSSVLTRHSISIVDNKNTGAEEDHESCVAVVHSEKGDTATPMRFSYDQGLADSNFDLAIKHFFLHAHAVSQILMKPVELPSVNHTLGIFVSGDGRISNGGDLFGPLVATQILEARDRNKAKSSSIQVVIGSDETAAPRAIAVVGSTIQWTNREPNLVAWGTGIIKKMKVPLLAENSSIIAVRGPRTRDLLLAQQGLNPMVISDPALIARDMIESDLDRTLRQGSGHRKEQVEKNVCFIIHGVDRKYASEQCPFCMDRLVDNYNRNPKAILETMVADCGYVVSSSLHGCIFAHALGIPALPVALGDRIMGGDFKFVDYMHSVGVTSFQNRVNISQVWEEMDGNLTENDWKHMVSTMAQPKFPVQTNHFYKTFPLVA